MKKVRVAVIGTGYLGKIHASLLRQLPSCTLAAVCDSDPAMLERVSSELSVPGVSDHRRLFKTVDAVIIAVPTRLHYSVARDCLRAGLSCMVEKPFTTTVREADELIRLARKAGLALQVGHVERFNPAFAASKKLFGKPYFIECHRLSGFPNRSLDIGVILDLMIHDIDIVLGLVRSPIRRIDAVGVNVLTPFEDIANARITFANGCICNLTASRISEEPVRKIRIFLKEAYISLDYRNEQASVYRKKAGTITKESIPIEREQPLKRELVSFISCVRNGTEPVVNGETAREALDVALKIRKLIWRRRKTFSS